MVMHDRTSSHIREISYQKLSREWKLTKKRPEEKWYKRNIDDRRRDVDEPIWQERCNAKKYDVVEKMFTILLNLRTKSPPINFKHFSEPVVWHQSCAIIK